MCREQKRKNTAPPVGGNIKRVAVIVVIAVVTKNNSPGRIF
ncbi:MAG: hypothetical protein ACRD9R_21215 [Pyrinomonadaceae bacterium]